MKSGNLLLGLITCAAMCACTDNDIVDNGGNGGSQVFEGDTAYMIVNISEVGSAATKATSDGFVAGTESEHEVENIHFYLYSEDGDLIAQSTKAWSGSGSDEASGIELTGDKIVAISGLTGKEYPSYMVTVINVPSDFSVPETLDDWETVLASSNDTGIQDSDGYFTMCTSSYYDDLTTAGNAAAPSHDAYYFATPVGSENFTNELITDIPDPVTVYVERLAVKVYVSSKITYSIYLDGLASKGTPTTDDYYCLMGYVYGESVSNLLKQIWRKNNSNAGISQVDYEPLYRFIGWDLTATEKQSYMMKHIDSEWNDEYTGWKSFDWNDEPHHRSYWGKSVHYGLDGSYPTKASEIASSKGYLNYISADDIEDGKNTRAGYYNIDDMGYRYCAENTNTAGASGIIKSEKSSAITSIIVKAQLYIGYPACATYDGTDGPENTTFEETPYNLVRYGDDLYFEDAYLIYVLSEKITTPIYVKSGDSDYEEIDYTYLQLEDLGDGYVGVTIKEKDGDNNDYEYFEDSEGATKLTTEEINSIIESEFGDIANGYTEGYMYYYIPIEHLNDNTEKLEEANYGVVRNHYYDVEITSVEDLGRGIYNTDEEIIPQPDTETYYLGAQINILSWKEVKQTVSF